jgi:hypothetical protein
MVDLTMDVSYPSFGTIVVEGTGYDHDIVIERGTVRRRRKGPSRRHRSRYGHTPVSEDEDLPWHPPTLVIGSGYSGRLPIMPEIEQEAAARRIELVVVPTAEACEMLCDIDPADVNALLHVTC